MHAQISVSCEGGEDRVGDRPDTGLDGRLVGDPLGDQCGDPVVELGPRRGRHLDERTVDLDPSEDLTDVDLVAPERTWLLDVGFEEEAGPPDERSGIVGVHSEAEVAVPVERRRGGENQWVASALAEQVAHLAEVVGDEVDRPCAEAWPGDMGQEVRQVL